MRRRVSVLSISAKNASRIEKTARLKRRYSNECWNFTHLNCAFRIAVFHTHSGNTNGWKAGIVKAVRIFF